MHKKYVQGLLLCATLDILARWLPFFWLLFFPELRALANRNAGLPCGRAGITHGYSHGYSRRFAVTTFSFFSLLHLRSLPLTQNKKVSVFFQVGFDFDETRDIMLATQRNAPPASPPRVQGAGFSACIPGI